MISLVDLIGYTALITNLISMNMKNMVSLRFLAGTANAIYIIYGIILNAYPIIIGCIIAVTIHGYHLHKITSSKKIISNTNC